MTSVCSVELCLKLTRGFSGVVRGSSVSKEFVKSLDPRLHLLNQSSEACGHGTCIITNSPGGFDVLRVYGPRKSSGTTTPHTGASLVK